MDVHEQITAIIDKHLDKLVNIGLNKLPIKDLQPEMSDPTQDPKEEWRIWFPIKSCVTDSEISDFEDYIGFKFPNSYKAFLKHKHFYDLQIGEVSFCSHPIRFWRGELSGMIFESYPREFLIDRGLIPFATYSDWGMVCFNTNMSSGDDEYQIVQWDHERVNSIEPIASNFADLLKVIDKEDENFG